MTLSKNCGISPVPSELKKFYGRKNSKCAVQHAVQSTTQLPHDCGALSFFANFCRYVVVVHLKYAPSSIPVSETQINGNSTVLANAFMNSHPCSNSRVAHLFAHLSFC